MQLIYNQQITTPCASGREVSKNNTFAASKTVYTNRVRRLFVCVGKLKVESGEWREEPYTIDRRTTN